MLYFLFLECFLYTVDFILLIYEILSYRSDLLLQSLVYKLVPGLLTSELYNLCLFVYSLGPHVQILFFTKKFVQKFENF